MSSDDIISSNILNKGAYNGTVTITKKYEVLQD